jgi:hypothetical protein
MHPRFAERRAWVGYERSLTEDQPTMTKKKARPVYAVQWGATAPDGRTTDALPCKDMREAARMAANTCWALGALSPAYNDDYWLLTEEGKDELVWRSSTQFVKLTRTYPK